MDGWQERTGLLLGAEAQEALSAAHVLVCGVGGVGAYAAEMLARSGVGRLTLIDSDRVQSSNINRQLPALHSTVGRHKVEIMSERLRDINPLLQLSPRAEYIEEETAGTLLDALQPRPDFIVDAIDTIAPKCALLVEAHRRGIPIVSSMGAGAKSDVTKVQYGRLGKTFHCTLARAVRQRLKKQNASLLNLPVVFSAEQADERAVIRVMERNKKSTCGTVSFLPAVFGCYLAAFVVRKLAGLK